MNSKMLNTEQKNSFHSKVNCLDGTRWWLSYILPGIQHLNFIVVKPFFKKKPIFDQVSKVDIDRTDHFKNIQLFGLKSKR